MVVMPPRLGQCEEMEMLGFRKISSSLAALLELGEKSDSHFLWSAEQDSYFKYLEGIRNPES